MDRTGQDPPEVESDEKITRTGNATGGATITSADTLSGGEEREGGVPGTPITDMGSDTQTPNSYP
ncbi:hypothetical protein [Pseudomonas phage PIP]|nr:hypothetical protein [Pseudomonas phage PIP]